MKRRNWLIVLLVSSVITVWIALTSHPDRLYAAEPDLAIPPIYLELIHQRIPEYNVFTSIIPLNETDLLIATQDGRVYQLKPPPAPYGIWEHELYFSISSEVLAKGDLGFYSLALSPSFASDNTLYFSYVNRDEDLVIERYNSVLQSRQVVLTIPSTGAIGSDAHRGGSMTFHEGLLYISTGDNILTYPAEPGHPSQDLNSLMGKILRIDVESGDPLTYTIPIDNPYVGMEDHRPEVWHYGLRNPWGIDFDKVTGDLFIADVGEYVWEEVNYAPSGESGLNYGWRCYEGNMPYTYDDPACFGIEHVSPIHTYPHKKQNGRVACSVTGGRVYRGNHYPALNGLYFYTDFCDGRIRVMTEDEEGWRSTIVAELEPNIYPTTVGKDGDGSIYVGSVSVIYKIVTPITYLPLISHEPAE